MSIWKMVSIVGYSLACLGFITTIVMYFKMNIKSVYEDVTGKTAKRKLQELIEQEKVANEERFRIDDYDPKNAKLPTNSVRFQTAETNEDTARFSEPQVQLLAEESKVSTDKFLDQFGSTTVLEEHTSHNEGTQLLDELVNQPFHFVHEQVATTLLVAEEEIQQSGATEVLDDDYMNEPTEQLVDEKAKAINYQEIQPNEPNQKENVVKGSNLHAEESGTTELSVENTKQPSLHSFEFEITKSRMIVYKRESIEGVF